MAIPQLTVNGVNRNDKLAFGTLETRDNINERVDTCRFAVREYGTQTWKPEVGQEVTVTVDGTRIFGGVIVDVEQSVEGQNVVRHDVSCKDWVQHFDRELVTERYEDTNMQAIIQDLVTRYAAAYGFTYTNVGGASIGVESISFGEMPLSECMNKIARFTNYSWYIDPNKDLHFFAKTEEEAPFVITQNDGSYIPDSLIIKSDISQLWNRIKVRGGDARGDERTKLWAGDGETDIFGTDHKFAEVPTVTVDGSPVTVGVDYIDKDEDFDCMWSYQQKYIRFTTGNIPAAPGSGETNISITGIPLRPIIVQKQNNASIGTYGLYEYRDRNDSIKTREEALLYAQAQLDARAASIRAGKFQTYTQGLRSGQTIQISIGTRGINESFLIQSVRFRQVSPEGLNIWDVEIASVKTLSMLDVLQRLVLDELIEESVEDILLNFFQFEDGVQFGDEVGDITTYTTENFTWEQDNPGLDDETQPIVWNKFTWTE